ncbi:MAG: MmgE/PrpD family protein [Lentisphaerae bacterium]|nr:MmgE/PrpD family protein [Lentisphaerota bacterium]
MTERPTADPIAALAQFAAEEPGNALPGETLSFAWDLFVDTMGCILAGSSAEGVDAIRRQYLDWGGCPTSTVLPSGDRIPPPGAAFVNSVSAHARDYDDTHDGAILHSCVTIVPACLAVAEARGHGLGALPKADGVPVSGREFAAALAMALEVGTRLGLAFIPYLHTGWLPTTMWGPFAAAAGCSRLLHLDSNQTRHALGIAYAQVHGNRQALIDGTLAKRVQPGFSAVAGLQAACLAARGITGAEHVVNGTFGLAELYTNGQADRDCITLGLGSRYDFLETSIKPFPCCRCTHAVIDGADRIRQEHAPSAEDIVRGCILLPPNAMGQVGNPFHLRDNPTVDAQFSAPYTAAYTLIHGPPGLSAFDADRVRADADVIALARKFSAQSFEPGNSGLVPTEIEVEMRDGGKHRVRMEEVKGSREYPLTDHDRRRKFEDCAAHASPPLKGITGADLHDVLRNGMGCDDMRTIARACCPG